MMDKHQDDGETFMLRSSSYNIYIPLPKRQKGFLLIHGYTGAYDKISQRVKDLLDYLSQGSEQSIDELALQYGVSETIIHQLKKRGYITSLSIEDEQKLFRQIARYLHKRNEEVNYIFFMTYDCNLACPYCFQNELRKRRDITGYSFTREGVDRICKAINFIHSRYYPDTKRTRIGFYGGEPFLKRQYASVHYILEQCKAMIGDGVEFWGVTNGTDLHFYKELLGPGKIQSLQITLDGPPEQHDQRRKYADGRGSFYRIAENITLALQKGVKVSVRVNIDRNNMQYLPALMDEVYRQGWPKFPNFRIYTAVVHASIDWFPDNNTLFSRSEANTIIRELQLRYPELEAPDERLRKQIERIFSSGQPPQFRASYCGAHQGMYIFDPFDNIYTCWELTADPKMRIGYITPEGEVIFEKESFAFWKQQRTVADMEPCQRCPYALYCGGGCAVQAKVHKGSFFASYCDGFQKRFQQAAIEAYQKVFS